VTRVNDGLTPDQRIVRLTGIGDGERDVGGDDRPLPQRLQIGLGVDGILRRVQLQADHERELLLAAGVRQREAGDPQQLLGRLVGGPGPARLGTRAG
jgi:hypothetical protein